MVEEKTGSTVTRQYVLDDAGSIVKLIIPTGQSNAGTYLVTWNGHGDALALYKISTTGTLTLANRFSYDTWGNPTVSTYNSYPDLGFRYLYVGRYGVQWESYLGLNLYYMSARHYAPQLGRFIQPDPSNQEASPYAYTANSPVTRADPDGRRWTSGTCGNIGLFATCPRPHWARFEVRVFSSRGPILGIIGAYMWANISTGATGVFSLAWAGVTGDKGHLSTDVLTGPGKVYVKIVVMKIWVLFVIGPCTAYPNFDWTVVT